MSCLECRIRAPRFANERNGGCKLSSLSRQTAFWLRAVGGTCVKAHVRPIRGEGGGGYAALPMHGQPNIVGLG